MKIGVDIMGGDFAPEATTLGSILAHKECPELELVLLGNQEEINKILEREKVSPSQFEIIHCDQVVEMCDHPTRVLVQKPNSSIAVGFKLLKEGKIDALASTGNTGAMLVGSMYVVNSIPGIIRPCITSVLPKENGGVGIILDVGSNADCKPDVLYQFAVLGSIYAESVYEIENPRVALLNIGEEEEKGNILTQATHKLMKGTKDFNFVGNVESRDLFNDNCDVIVCDGFTGNVILKEAEAFYTIFKKRGLIDPYIERFNYENYGGTPVMGVQGNVIIGHGISNEKAIKNMIKHSAEVVKADLPNKIKEALENE